MFGSPATHVGPKRDGDDTPVVDDVGGKDSSVHTLAEMFSQVRGSLGVKLFFFPQASAQAVHKEERVFHNLSTPSRDSGLGRIENGGYRG